MPRRILVLVVLLVAVLPASSAAASPSLPTYLQVAYQQMPGPCTGQVEILWKTDLGPDAEVPGYNAQAEASGIAVQPDGSWVRVDCSVTIDPAAWAAMSSYARCVVIVHEVGHLGFRRHTATGIMAATGPVNTYAPCAQVTPPTLPVRALHYLTPRLRDWNVQCNDRSHGAVACQALRGARTISYVVRPDGSRLSVRRVTQARNRS